MAPSSSQASVAALEVDGPFGLVTNVVRSRDGHPILVAARSDFSGPVHDPKHSCCDLPQSQALWATDADGGNPVLLSAPGTSVDATGGEITPDGSRAAWSEKPAGDPEAPAVFVRANTDGTQRQTLPPRSPQTTSEALAPNGDVYKVVDLHPFASPGPSNPRLMVAPWGVSAFKTVTVLNPRRAQIDGSGESLDGSKQCFYFRRGSTDVWTIDHDTGHVTRTRLPATLKDGSPADRCYIANTGRTVLPAERHGANVVVVVDNGRARVLRIPGAAIRRSPLQNPGSALADISPDGAQVALTLNPSRTGNARHPALMSLRDGRVSHIGRVSRQNDELNFGGWSPNGRYVLLENGAFRVVVYDNSSHTLSTIPVSMALRGGGTTPLATFSPTSTRVVLTSLLGLALGFAVNGQGPAADLGLLYRFIASGDGGHCWALQAELTRPGVQPAIPFWAISPEDVGVVSAVGS